MENENTTSTEPKSGGLVAVIIIIVLLIAGGWYFIGGKVGKIQEQKATTANEVVTGTSTEVTDIQTDLDNIDLKILD